MVISIDVPDSAWSEQNVPIDGVDYLFEFTFNSRDRLWTMNVYDGEYPVILGTRLLVSGNLFGNYVLDNFEGGLLTLLRVKDDGQPVGRNNLGIDKAYQLIYISDGELESIYG